MCEEPTLRYISTASEIEKHREIKNIPGVYVFLCKSCGRELYGGQTDDLYGRIRTHTFFPPYGAIDIVIGEVLNPVGRRMWESLCEHLRNVAESSREEIGDQLVVHVAAVSEQDARNMAERKVFSRYPKCFGQGVEVWADWRTFNYKGYKSRKRRR